MLAGLEDNTAGAFTVDGVDVTDRSPKEGDIAMVFQNYALYAPFIGCRQHRLPAQSREGSEKQRQQRVHEIARVLRLTSELGKRAAELSGGQRQRVAMGRALVRRPKLFLMDEPLSNLDAKLRLQMRGEITRLQKELAITTFYVTHDQVEAMAMADRVAVMHKGVLQQVAPPDTLYGQPDNLFVAAFVGSPAMNLFTVDLIATEHGLTASAGSLRFAIPNSVTAARPNLVKFVGQRVALGIRPEAIEDVSIAPSRPGHESQTVTIDLGESLGPELLAHFNIAAPPVTSAGALDDFD